jgi:hypothetical protein
MSPELFQYVKLEHEERRRQARLLRISRILWLVSAFFAGVTVGLLVGQW